MSSTGAGLAKPQPPIKPVGYAYMREVSKSALSLTNR